MIGSERLIQPLRQGWSFKQKSVGWMHDVPQLHAKLFKDSEGVAGKVNSERDSFHRVGLLLLPNAIHEGLPETSVVL